MKPSFSVIVAHGSRVRRLWLPRWVAYGVVWVLAAASAALAGLSRDYVRLTRQRSEMAALRRHVDEARELVGSLQTRVAAVRGEIVSWKELHGRMLGAFRVETVSNLQETELGDGVLEAHASTVDFRPRLPEEEVELLASNVAEEGARLRDLERVVQRTGKMMSALPLGWPVRGQVKSEFGMRVSPWTGAREPHEGIDIGGRTGTAVLSPAPGTVVAAGSYGTYGRQITVDHGHGVRSRYGHLKQVDVKVGQRVEKGNILGLVGSTGRSTGPHLHYEVLVNGTPVNPRDFLWNDTLTATTSSR